MKALITAVSGVALAFGLISSANAATRVGVLRCHVHGGASYVVGSAHKARCVFTSESGRRERYWGSLKRVGVDLGYTHGSVVTWAVFAPSDLGRRALVGDYAGASADVAAGVGGGANVLVGGNARTVSLQPLSLKTETGLALGAGAGLLELR
jgi:ABC-type cobalamin transport system permease subunit